MSDAVLVLNAGSSSIKFALFSAEGPADTQALVSGLVERIGAGAMYRFGHDPVAPVPGGHGDSHANAMHWLVAALMQRFDGIDIVAGGHRVVHGGADFAAPVIVTPQVHAKLAALAPLAPAHQPHNLAGVDALAAALPEVPQVACFDTAFHRSQPRLAQLFAIPRALTEGGVLRYGFHGLSYEYIASVLPHYMGARAQGRIIAAHLGHGASMCAFENGASVATSMGFTALDGLMMGRRCGEIDPGVLLHLMRDRGMSVAEVDDLLSNRSGLLGVSGLSHDMRDLLASPAPEAEEAVALFCYRAARMVGSLAAALGGIDALVFTAGIGEHAPRVRARIMEGCRWLGLEPDTTANLAGGPLLSADGSVVAAYTIPTDEERMIARHTTATLGL
ncbi:acetate/propionate family kinase (plasmid) [Paroceanicella profunda]|uniref:Acetate kinase n=1 Tax=Paroceanicella profunda TaxID=2579971 RepID=A0A5B8G4I1_9RHOB|nr:acetate/propionate family kinase [Paroceanicella profunda]QDL94212.1 acetate/propionate family kinase [Paroceanicella profunda]